PPRPSPLSAWRQSHHQHWLRLSSTPPAPGPPPPPPPTPPPPQGGGAPPMKQAAMTSSSKPRPALGVAVFSRAAKTSPASAARTPMLTKVRNVSCSVLMPDNLAALALPPTA